MKMNKRVLANIIISGALAPVTATTLPVDPATGAVADKQFEI